ncbi:MAG: AraC family transcriptional regulator [Thermoanaerobaculia bacterium]
MDPLSDVLRAVRLDGAFFYLVEAAPPWSVASVAARELVPRVLPGSEHLIPYHILTSGSCWAGVAGEEQVLLQAGDVVVFPQGDPHLMSSAQGRRADPDVQGTSPDRYPGTVHVGPEAAPETTFVCGFLGCDVRPYNPLLASLPRRMHVPGIAGGWLSEFPKQVVAECRTAGAGSETMLTRMAELMFIEVVRRHLEFLPPEKTGWLAGLRDPVVGPALTLLHTDPARAWTLADLAREAASSRSVLAERFSQLVGTPPMQYLTMWRLQLASEKLARGTRKVGAIGAEVGYESEPAFSRAFKRATGQSPSAWRRARQGA